MTSPEGAPPTEATTAPPVDEATIQATIDQALRTGTGRLDMDELTALEELLLGHIQLLLPDAEAATDRLWRGSITWYTARARIDSIHHQVKQGLGNGPLAAHIQVDALARDCHWLLIHHQHRQQA
ncbi:DUF6415 family natural product biosynthesis protein [Streptomyces sp. NPDC002055]|uniref:DUF6415 family natural product biosynthesis protein n=1 Tax=Streptomyces sp. NPDC002055 TaxID=3154534 RepID=UPI00332122C6